MEFEDILELKKQLDREWLYMFFRKKRFGCVVDFINDHQKLAALWDYDSNAERYNDLTEFKLSEEGYTVVRSSSLSDLHEEIRSHYCLGREFKGAGSPQEMLRKLEARYSL